MVFPIARDGRRSCVNCDNAKKNGKVQRYWCREEFKWKFYRSCHWCGCCWQADESEYVSDGKG